jgi:WXG100 family type VII secretion target
MAHDFGATYSEMEGAAQRLRDGRTSVTDTLKELQGVIEDLVQDGFKTENASGQYSTAYDELTSSLDDAAEAVNDMATALDQMADKIRDTDQL